MAAAALCLSRVAHPAMGCGLKRSARRRCGTHRPLLLLIFPNKHHAARLPERRARRARLLRLHFQTALLS